jgi:hypothetical protein
MRWKTLRTICAVLLLCISVSLAIPPVSSERPPPPPPSSTWRIFGEAFFCIMAIDTFVLLIGLRRVLAQLMVEIVLYAVAIGLFVFFTIEFLVTKAWQSDSVLVIGFAVLLIGCFLVIFLDALHEYRSKGRVQGSKGC